MSPRRTLAALASALMIGAGPAAALDVVFVNPGGAEGFWGNASGTMRAAARDLGITLEVIDAERNRIVMTEAVKEIAARADKPDYVVLVNELQRGPAMYAQLRDAGIPALFIVNTLSAEQKAELGDTSGILASIAPENEAAGYEMAVSLIEAATEAGMAGDGVQILALLGDTASPAAVQREAGLRRAVAEHGNAQIVRDFPVNWNRDEAEERTALFLKSLRADVVWSANDEISLGAQEAAREHGLTPGRDIFFAGLNWIAPAMEAVRDGEMTLTHGGHFFAGAWSMVILHDLATGAVQAPVDLNFPMNAITRDNVETFLDRLGDRDWDAIDFTRFSLSPGAPGYDLSAEAILAAAGGS